MLNNHTYTRKVQFQTSQGEVSEKKQKRDGTHQTNTWCESDVKKEWQILGQVMWA